MEPRQPQQLKYEWKTPEMVKQSGKTRREVEKFLKKRSNMFTSQSFVLVVVNSFNQRFQLRDNSKFWVHKYYTVATK